MLTFWVSSNSTVSKHPIEVTISQENSSLSESDIWVLESGTRSSHVTGGCVTASDIETIQSLLKPRRLDVVNRKKRGAPTARHPKKSQDGRRNSPYYLK